MITYPRAADGDGYDILVDGVRCGSISRGWMRMGGMQWVVTRPGFALTGRPTLAEAKRVAARAFANHSNWLTP